MHTSPSLDAQNTERRYLPRWEASNRVIYRCESDKSKHEGKSRDVHFAGASLYVDHPLPPNQKLKMTIYLSDNDTVDVVGKILWNKELGKECLIGVQFFEVSKEVQDTLLKYAFELKKEDLIKHWFEGWNSP